MTIETQVNNNSSKVLSLNGVYCCTTFLRITRGRSLRSENIRSVVCFRLFVAKYRFSEQGSSEYVSETHFYGPISAAMRPFTESLRISSIPGWHAHLLSDVVITSCSTMKKVPSPRILFACRMANVAGDECIPFIRVI